MPDGSVSAMHQGNMPDSAPLEPGDGIDSLM